ncbi:MAG: phosphoenolpyruvate--protein phosphotransferase [Planctomycetota bacterium]|nr:phosphoenolpyruvate--protein phosphotransferase [Planctomycetota bacterium]
MQTLQGIAVSPGVAIGEALVIDNEGFRIPQRFVARDAVQAEIRRLTDAIAGADKEIAANRDTVTEQLGKHYGAIFGAHLKMLHDSRLRREIESMIRQKHYSPEYAVSRTMRRYAKVFQSLDNAFMKERSQDIFDIEKRLLKHLLQDRREDVSQLSSPVVLLAHNLTPSETANLNRKYALGFVTEAGGPGSHTAIVAEAMRLPAVVATGPFLTDVSGGDLVIIDGNLGRVILQPDEETVAKYRYEAEEHRSVEARLKSFATKAAETSDGERIQLSGNIEFPYEVEQCQAGGADGIGLYRTEFLYLNAKKEPTEATHYKAYRKVLIAMSDKPVCVRTLDLGADKLVDDANPGDEKNPVLGLRSIRLTLRNVPLFRTQLRAILRASALGKVQIMFPLITTLKELRQAKMLLTDVMEDLEESKIDFDRNIKVGIMVEVPATALMLERFLDEVDFVSIGTNDLIQYTLAVDRSNKDVASMYTASEPAVLRLIRMSIQAADRVNKPVNVCGQMSGNILYTMLLLGFGLKRFSVPPASILEIKKVISSVNIKQCQRLARRAMSMEHSQEIRNYLKEELRKQVPELVP